MSCVQSKINAIYFNFIVSRIKVKYLAQDVKSVCAQTSIEQIARKYRNC